MEFDHVSTKINDQTPIYLSGLSEVNNPFILEYEFTNRAASLGDGSGTLLSCFLLRDEQEVKSEYGDFSPRWVGPKAQHKGRRSSAAMQKLFELPQSDRSF